MYWVKYITLLDQIHYAIKHKRTGPPKDFAKRLNISESTLYRVLSDLKDRGAMIEYNQCRSTYVYENEVEIELVIKIHESQQIKGGKSPFNQSLSELTVVIPKLACNSY